MVSVQSIIVYVAGGICCLNAPTVIHRHYQVNSSPSKCGHSWYYFSYQLCNSILLYTSCFAVDLRNSIGQLRKEMNELIDAVVFLAKTIEKLENEVDE